MKKAIMIFTFILFSVISFSKPTIINLTTVAGNGTLIQSILSLVSKDLRLDTANMKIMVLSFVKKRDYIILATTKRLDKSQYQIHIWDFYRKEDFVTAMIHELVHVEQFNEGRLVLTDKHLSFDGNIVTTDTPYLERKHEQEAIQKSHELYLKYKDKFKGGCFDK